MAKLINKFKIETTVAIFTMFILFYFPYTLSQFALISFIIYLGLGATVRHIASKYSVPAIYIYMLHALAFLFAYSLFFGMYYGFAHIDRLNTFL